MLSYLMGKPSYYCSHEFRSLMFENGFRLAIAAVHALAEGRVWETQLRAQVQATKTLPKKLSEFNDYIFRPVELERFSWYFLVSACDAATHHEQNVLQWFLV